MIVSLRRCAARARLYRSGRWHRWWAWRPVITEILELVLWEWVERRSVPHEAMDSDYEPFIVRYTEYRMPNGYYSKKKAAQAAVSGV